MGRDGETSATQILLDLWREARCTDARDRLVAEYLPMVRRLSRKFGYLGEPLEDLVQVSVTSYRAASYSITRKSLSRSSFTLVVLPPSMDWSPRFSLSQDWRARHAGELFDS